MSPRLAPAERRLSIVTAAVPLFARKGFAGTTTREIAEAAGVSEALVFKYFATKTALYDAIMGLCQESDPDFDILPTLAPSTETLVKIVQAVTNYFATLRDQGEADKARHSLFLRSLTEDGEFAKVGMGLFAAAILPMFDRSFTAARRAGHLTATAPESATAFWMLAQLQLMLGAFALPTSPVAETAHIPTNEVVRFLLRGIGMTDAAMQAFASTTIETLAYSPPPLAANG